MMTTGEYFKRLFKVNKCSACREILDIYSFEHPFCPECERAIEIAKIESCPDCFKSMIDCTCQPKLLSQKGSLCLRKLYIYHTGKPKEPQNRYIYFLKHNTSKRAFAYAAQGLWRGLKSELAALGYVDSFENCLITNVPRTKKALVKYGFDQSARICQAIGELSGVAYAPLLKRKFGGREQKKLNAAERKKNMSSVIYPNKKLKDSARGKCVILFDDIVTTGSSMAACISVLKKMGVKQIICCTLAVDLKNKSAR